MKNVIIWAKGYFAFYVNLVKTCTDITLEMHEKCARLHLTAEERIENLSDDLLRLFCVKIRKGIYNEKTSECLASSAGAEPARFGRL